MESPVRAQAKPRNSSPDNRSLTRLIVVALGSAVAAALVALVGAAFFTAAFGPQTLADPGPLVRWGLSVSTVLTELSIAVTVGALMLAVFVVPGGGQARRTRNTRTPAHPSPIFTSTMTVAAYGAGAWTLTALAKLLFAGANTIGVPLSDPNFGLQWATYVTKIPSGRMLLVIVLVAAIVTALCVLVSGPVGAIWTLSVASLVFVFMALMGHAAGSANHEQAVSAMFLHLVGAAVWIGALVTIAFLYLNSRLPHDDLTATVTRYSTIAGWCFALVAASGLVNALIRLGGMSGLTTDYGILILVKTAIFIVLGGFGWAHRTYVINKISVTRGRISGHLPRLFWQLAAAELVIMGMVSGVSVALGGTNPPDEGLPSSDPSPAYLITGSELPPEPTATSWFTQWKLDSLFAFLCVAGLIVYWRWAARLHARGDSWPWIRTASWTIAMIMLAWVTSGGPAVYGKVLFSAHMVMHMIMAMVIPIFLTSAAPITLLMRAVPARKDNSRGPREWVLGIIHSRYGRFFSHPIVAAVNFAGSMILFYYTPFFEYAMSTHIGHILMIVHFTLVGYFFTNALIGIDPGPNRPPFAQRLLLLLATMAFHAFFGVTLMASHSLLAADWFGLMGRTWGLSAIEDQQKGGAVAWGIGEVPTVALAIMVAVLWAKTDERAARRRDRQVDEYGDQELEEYNKMLAQKAQEDELNPRN
ncbi:cytochrome c oxidase assembly protein [Timonella sp. A28]|uniref:cytochrome c oxidase assembly protein n=1 Tax=Timonella sp. A28 TaxID=3442640 RepID=UPI003EBB9621